MKILLAWLIILLSIQTNCSEHKGVEVILNSPDGKFDFGEIEFLARRIHPNYSLSSDFERILKDNALYEAEKKSLKKNWFLTHYLNLDHDSDYLIRLSGIKYPTTEIILPDLIPIFRNKINKINLYTKFNPIIKVQYAPDGNPNNLKFSWEPLPSVAYYSLYVTLVVKEGPPPESAISCFVKNRNHISIEEAFKWVSKEGKDFPNIPQEIITYSKIKKLPPGLYEFAIIAWAYEPQLSHYIRITDNNNPDTKTQININPY